MIERPKVRVMGDLNHMKACVGSCIDKHAPILTAKPGAAVRVVSECVRTCIKPKPNPLELAACAEAQRACMGEAKDKYSLASKECKVERDACITAIVPKEA